MSSRGGTGRSTGRSSEPNERTRYKRIEIRLRYSNKNTKYILTFSESNSGLLWVDRVEDSLIANFRLGNERDLAAKEGRSVVTGRGSHRDECW